MMYLVTLLEAAQDADSILDRRLIDHDGLEAALKGGVFLDVLAVFIEGGRAYAMQFSARQHGFEHIGGIHCPLGCARAHQSMQLVDKEDDSAFSANNFFEDSFQAFLELAAKLGTRDQRAKIECDHLFICQRFGDIAAHDALGQSLDYGGLTHARLTDQHGVIFGAAAEHLDDAANLFVAPDDGIELTLGRQLGEVAAIPL